MYRQTKVGVDKVGFAGTKRKRLLIFTGILLALLGLLVLWGANAGYYLVKVEEPEKADAIIVLMGSGPDRVLHAVDLYNEGYASRILMVEENQPGFTMVEALGVEIPRSAEISAMVGMQLGVPEGAFTILPGDALSTQDEARIITGYLRQHEDIRRVLLVTSAYHSSRAYRIFRWELGGLKPQARVISCPTPYDNVNPKAWWRSREDTKWVVMEYAKWANFYIFDRWR